MEESEEKSSTEKKFIKNSFWNALTVLSAKIGGMIFIIILARFLLPEKFGIYSLALSVALFAITFTNLATNQTLSRYLSDALGEKDNEKAGSYYKFIFKIKIWLSFISSIALIILAYPLSLYLFNKPELTIPIIFFSLYIITFSFQNLYETLFYVIGRVRFLTFKEIMLQFSKILICVILFSLFYPSIFLSAIAIILSSLLAIIFMKCNLKKNASFLFNKKKKEIEKGRIVCFIKRNIVSSMSTTLFAYVDILLLGIFVSPSFVGYYSSAFLIIAGLFGFIGFSNVSLPLFTQMDKGNLSEAFGKIFKYISMMSIPIIFGILSLGKYIIRFMYGYEYIDATIPLLVLSILIFESPITDNLKSILLAKEKPQSVAKVVIFATVLNAILNLILISILVNISMLWAIIGAAIATVFSRLIIFLSLSIIVKHELNVSYNFKTIFKPIIASSMMMAIILLVNTQIRDMTYLIGIGEVLLGILIYFGIMLLIKGIEKKDISLIKNLISK